MRSSQDTQIEIIGSIVRTVEAIVLKNPNGFNISAQRSSGVDLIPHTAAKERLWITGRRLRLKQPTTAAVVRRRWMCHTRTMLLCGAAGRQLCSQALSACWLTHERVAYVREKNRPLKQKPREICFIHPRAQKKVSRACHAQHTARIEPKP